MSWADMADRVLKASIQAFKTEATYTRDADPGNPISIDGVFDSAHQLVDPETGAPVDSTAPSLGIRLADLPEEPEPDDEVEIGEVTYFVDTVEEDGQGGAKLILRKKTS